MSDRIQGFLAGEGMDRFADRDTLAATAVAGFAATPGPNANAFLRALWDMPVPTGEQCYFDGMLQLLSLMHCSGHFRVIDGREGAVRG